MSRPFFSDPEHWKPTQLRAETLLAVRQQFRKKFPNVTNCEKLEEADRPWNYKDQNIKLLKAYSSNRGWAIADVLLEGYGCDGPPDDPFQPQWFVITPAKEIRYLDSNMWLVDAGDYDNDGQSELVFSIDDYNRGGYKLFYADFQKKAVFEFNVSVRRTPSSQSVPSMLK